MGDFGGKTRVYISGLSCVASEFGVAESECAVIRYIDYEEADEFKICYAFTHSE